MTERTDSLPDRIDYDDEGNLDDVAISDVSMFRLEYMNHNSVWVCAYKPDGSRVSFWLRAPGKITAHHEWE